MSKKCVFCETTCEKCRPFTDYGAMFSYRGVPVKIVPITEINEILKLSVCDEVRAIVGNWLR